MIEDLSPFLYHKKALCAGGTKFFAGILQERYFFRNRKEIFL